MHTKLDCFLFFLAGTFNISVQIFFFVFSLTGCVHWFSHPCSCFHFLHHLCLTFSFSYPFFNTSNVTCELFRLYSSNHVICHSTFQFALSMLGAVGLHAAQVFVKPPPRYPDLYPFLISVYSCAHLLCFYLYFNYLQFTLPYFSRAGYVKQKTS